MKNKAPKVVGVGFQKTGTSSLREALKILGYRVGDTRYKLLFPILREKWKVVFKELDRYDAVEDNPWPLIFKEIDSEYKGSKFILTLRDSESWFKSVAKHIGNLRDPMHEWIYGRTKGIPSDDKANTIHTFERHNQLVLEYFQKRPEDLLVINFKEGHGWKEICEFLGHEIPKVDFPHENKAIYGKSTTAHVFRRIKIMKKRLKYRFQIWVIDLFKLWRPSINEE